MRFAVRAFFGLLITLVAVAILSAGAIRFVSAGGDESARRRPPTERSYAVRVAVLEPQTARPVTLAYGELTAPRRLTLRAAVAGRIVDVSPDLRDGAQVSRGDALYRIDPADGETAQTAALTRLTDARSEQAEARQAARLAEADQVAAERQRDIQREARDRRRSLFQQGYATRDAFDSAELTFQSADQTVAARRQASFAARERLERVEQTVARAQLDVDRAARDLGDTTVRAPFNGVLTGVNGVLGRLVSVNESLGELIDLSSLEVAFQVSERQYARLTGPEGALAALPLTVESDRGAMKITARGALDRPAAETKGGGRRVYGRLEPQAGVALRPGDFVAVRVEEPALENTAMLPARAVTEDGRILTLSDEGRLEEIQLEILRRSGDQVIALSGPFGARYVLERAPQLGPGVKARDAEAPEPERQGRPGGGRPQGAGGKP